MRVSFAILRWTHAYMTQNKGQFSKGASVKRKMIKGFTHAGNVGRKREENNSLRACAYEEKWDIRSMRAFVGIENREV